MVAMKVTGDNRDGCRFITGRKKGFMLWLWLAYNKNDGYEKDLRIEIKRLKLMMIQSFMDHVPFPSPGSNSFKITYIHVNQLKHRSSERIITKIQPHIDAKYIIEQGSSKPQAISEIGVSKFGDLGLRFVNWGIISIVLEDASRFVVVMHNVVSGGGRGRCSTGGPICYCGMKCVVRTARTIKNRGKQFWGCPKFKNGGEDGCCNYFSWCADHGVVETKTTGNCEGKFESLLNREAMEAGWKIISDLDLSVKKFGNRLNVLLGVVCVLVLVNIIVDMNDFIVVLIECT
ncbi:hypothetical protein V8G54_035697 [Vigna mungo]|uniref:GRF-type domain-containing protein n=1 Tax=Vigna mungo TaxID=3915 RepID=A0AAQ3RBE7_VIGMU